MTSLDQLHAAHVTNLRPDRSKLIDYYRRNARVLLEYYEGQGPDEYLLHTWRMQNEPHYTKVLTLPGYGRCPNCNSRLADDACSRCGCHAPAYQYEDPTFEQRSDCHRPGYRRTGFLAGHLIRMKLDADLQERIMIEFRKVEHAFSRIKGTRRNMLPYKMVIKKLLLRLNCVDLAESIACSASYENLLQQEALWSQIEAQL